MPFAQGVMHLFGSQSIESGIDKRLEKMRVDPSPPAGIPFSITVPVEPLDILGWLRRQDTSPRTYWASRNGETEIGGRGAATAVVARRPLGIETGLRDIEALLDYMGEDPFMRLIGGRCFDAHAPGGDFWSDFPPLWFVIPEILISREKSDHFLTITTRLTRSSEKEGTIEKIHGILSEISLDAPPMADEPPPAIRSRNDHPDRAGWSRRVNRLLDEIARKNVDKVVLARRTDLVFAGRIDPFRVLAGMKGKNRNCFTFLLEPRPGKAFVGASPERLFKVEGSRIASEAISGTTGRRMNFRSAGSNTDAPLYSKKNLLEHQFVLDDISGKIEVLCDSLHVSDERSTFELSNISHIYSRITGRLKEDISLSRIVSTLHPTPAVGGTPREKALPIVRDLEPFNRGWYASPVGIIGRDRTDMAVAIRSAVIEENRASLFAGAGIVPGSSPGAEWRELEQKISNSIEGLNGVLH